MDLQTFGTVNFVKLVYDNKTGKSRGYGFLYMNDSNGDAAVDSFARSNSNRITILNKSGVFIKRNDKKRQNPIRNPKRGGGMGGPQGGRQYSNQPSYDYYGQADAGYYGQQNPAYAMGQMPGVAATGYDPSQYSQDYSSYQYANPAQYAVPTPQHLQNGPPQQQMAAYAAGATAVAPQYAPAGAAAAAMPAGYPPTASTKVFLENLPLTATPDDICNCLFQYSLHVVLCTMEYDNDPKASWCYAHIEFANPEEATRCIALAQQSLLEYRGRIITASDDSNYQSPHAQQPAAGGVPPPGASPYVPVAGGGAAAPVAASTAPVAASNYQPGAVPSPAAVAGGAPPQAAPAAVPQQQYDQYGPPPVNNGSQPPPQQPNHYGPPSMNSMNNNRGGRGGGRGRGQNRSNRRHRPY